MKRLSPILIIFILFLSCNSNKKTDEQVESAKVDTIIGQYHVKFYLKENGNVISQRDYHYLDHSAYLTLSKNGSPILDNHLITRDDFTSIISQKELKKFHLWNMWVKDYSDTHIRLDCNVCVPDSDNCYFIIITIDDDGNISYEEEEVVWDEDE